MSETRQTLTPKNRKGERKNRTQAILRCSFLSLAPKTLALTLLPPPHNLFSPLHTFHSYSHKNHSQTLLFHSPRHPSPPLTSTPLSHCISLLAAPSPLSCPSTTTACSSVLNACREHLFFMCILGSV
ncbi:hypothetical protein PHAVU_011G115400 [Phaseolus vulgaris]|uniref:Uncharacterized protein n=1 Tax=Phaseolus vulgaris TaxID=3885 RepID=V7AIK9_PHAVU|nr:hypothetical protein PHAVU_011G115400g [Phaseolus vulgaris]ESW04673.1 hypothetical protein PHAVU_011G115400g [Phaseolus vulgaris]